MFELRTDRSKLMPWTLWRRASSVRVGLSFAGEHRFFEQAGDEACPSGRSLPAADVRRQLPAEKNPGAMRLRFLQRSCDFMVSLSSCIMS